MFVRRFQRASRYSRYLPNIGEERFFQDVRGAKLQMRRVLNQPSRRLHDQQGFSLIEMLAAIAIMGALIGIAVPTFIGARSNGQDSHAQANLRSALSAERTYYVDFQEYTTDAARLGQIEPDVDFSTTDAEVEGAMVIVGDPQVVVLVSTSQSGAQFCIMNIAADRPVASAVNGQYRAGTYYRRNPATVTTPPTSISVGQCGTSGYQATDAGWN